ncbi:MAG: hypothetical protein R3236_09670 [Phycisphaeraceae bacterium]|nr:hypothetical protein [Phycisphaeraceae bacterium]
MQIEHSQMNGDATSFQTKVDGQVKYETHLDFMTTEWYTIAAGDDSKLLLEGRLDPSISEDQMVEAIKPTIQEAIENGKI